MTDKIRPFVFSCDAHVAEPPDLLVKAMPDHLKQYVIHSEAQGDVRITRIGEQVILKINTNFHAHKTGEGDATFNAQAGGGASADRACTDASDNFVSDCAVDTKRRGARDLELRLADMDSDLAGEGGMSPSFIEAAEYDAESGDWRIEFEGERSLADILKVQAG